MSGGRSRTGGHRAPGARSRPGARPAGGGAAAARCRLGACRRGGACARLRRRRRRCRRFPKRCRGAAGPRRPSSRRTIRRYRVLSGGPLPAAPAPRGEGLGGRGGGPAPAPGLLRAASRTGGGAVRRWSGPGPPPRSFSGAAGRKPRPQAARGRLTAERPPPFSAPGVLPPWFAP